MKRTLVSLGAFFLVAALIYISIFIFDPGMYVETAFVIIVYPSIAVGIITAFAWRPKHRRG
jgi:hypothetical protein